MTCTDDTADRALGADCTGVSWSLVPRPVPRVIPVMRSERRSPFDRPSLGCEQREARLWHLGRSLVTLLASGTIRQAVSDDKPTQTAGLSGKARKCLYPNFPPAKGDAHGRDAGVSRSVDLGPRIRTSRDISSSNEGGG